MDGVGAGRERRVEDRVGPQVALGGRPAPIRTASSAACTWGASQSASEATAIVRMPSRRQVRMTRRAISPRLATRTDANTPPDPRRYIRNTPNGVSGIGALRAADRPRPSTVRVSAGSMMPSSHRRAVEK